MNTKELELVVLMLDKLSDILGTRSCNDWKFPDDWSFQEREDFVRGFHEWNGDPEEFVSGSHHISDFCVASMLSVKISAWINELD
ncbi:MAG: hypothetical protein JKY50_22565 [Oleispira sp.]|nr:hypothetical protein [Oleispira sp.]